MITSFENSKGYIIFSLTVEECKTLKREPECETCVAEISHSVFYVAAQNLLLCCKCYERWHVKIHPKGPENVPYENKCAERLINCLSSKISHESL